MLQRNLTDREYYGLLSTSMILGEWLCRLNPLPHLFCYLVSDCAWICVDEDMINRPRSELILHHVATIMSILCEYLCPDAFTFNLFMLLEINTVILLLKKNYRTRFLKYLLRYTWIIARLFILPYALYYHKFYVLPGRDSIYGILHLGPVILYILSVQWSLQMNFPWVLRDKETIYSSLFLLVPLINNNINSQWYTCIILLGLFSYLFHNSHGNIYLNSGDNASIVCCCILSCWENPSVFYMGTIYILSFLIRINNVVFLHHYVYEMTLVYNMYFRSNLIPYIIPTICGYYWMQKTGNTYLWHIGNGFYMLGVSCDLFGDKYVT